MTGAPEPLPARIIGLCTGRKDVDWFAVTAYGINEAKAVCATCPMMLPCYAVAVKNGEMHGVWGGVDFSQPKRTRGYVRGPGGCGTDAGYKAHKRNKEDACQPCKTAHNQYDKVYEARKRQRGGGM